MSLEIIFEDEFIVAANKPNNVVVHHAKLSRNVADESSLLQLIENQLKIQTFPIHRLDRKTSGIILLAKKKEQVSIFQELFTTNKIQKTYYGVVRGFSPETKTIDVPVKGRDAKVHKDALTHLKTLQNITVEIAVKPYDSSRYSLVELSPKTGRMHQLRIHLNKISHPLIGDPKYGDNNHNNMFIEKFGWETLFLHAGILVFKHPITNEVIELKAAFPKNWKELFSKFNWKNPLSF
ncbi:MAG: pseudouridine synthase [Flavobacteriaceae bacterium]|nr:pseudouridine synthase [Flavobacteriaceae bacterium]